MGDQSCGRGGTGAKACGLEYAPGEKLGRSSDLSTGYMCVLGHLGWGQ